MHVNITMYGDDDIIDVDCKYLYGFADTVYASLVVGKQLSENPFCDWQDVGEYGEVLSSFRLLYDKDTKIGNVYKIPLYGPERIDGTWLRQMPHKHIHVFTKASTVWEGTTWEI